MPEGTGQKKSKQPKASRKKKILNISLEISEIEYIKQFWKTIKPEVNSEKINENGQSLS